MAKVIQFKSKSSGRKGGIRVIGGEYRGRRLTSVKGMATRPTADRVRESIFNIIGDKISGARVLDLFAGTGAMGIEAMSRGADFALFIDNSPAAIKTIQHNIETLGIRMDMDAVILCRDIGRNLNDLQGTSEFDLIFMDPPYGKGLIEPTLAALPKTHSLRLEAIAVVEHRADEPIKDVSSFRVYDQRTYGKTMVSFFQYNIMNFIMHQRKE